MLLQDSLNSAVNFEGISYLTDLQLMTEQPSDIEKIEN